MASNEKGFARTFVETPEQAWRDHVDALVAKKRRAVQLKAIGVDPAKTSKRFDAPYFCTLMRRAEDDGLPVRAEHHELVGALRELRSIRKVCLRPTFDQEKIARTVAYLDSNIEALRAALQSGEIDIGQVTMCAACGQRPRWFGDFCPACAEEAGTRPHGKVGEEL